MNKLFKQFTFILLVLLISSCAGSKTASSSTSTEGEAVAEEVKKKKRRALTLADHIRGLPGVSVQGSGTYVKVVIRGQPGTGILGNDPLYLIDGIPAGSKYALVSSLVNPDDIESVQVLKSKSETAIYGAQGANGIISIKMKKK